MDPMTLVIPGSLTVLGVVSMLVAHQQGFNSWAWLFAPGLLGPLGLIVLALLPSANAAEIDEKVRQDRRKLGNTIGVVMSIGSVLLIGGIVFFLKNFRIG